MKVNCQEHRKFMELLSLRKRLGKGIPDPGERKTVQKRIRDLERDLMLD